MFGRKMFGETEQKIAAVYALAWLALFFTLELFETDTIISKTEHTNVRSAREFHFVCHQDHTCP